MRGRRAFAPALFALACLGAAAVLLWRVRAGDARGAPAGAHAAQEARIQVLALCRAVAERSDFTASWAALSPGSRASTSCQAASAPAGSASGPWRSCAS